MNNNFASSSDVLIQVQNINKASEFYENVLGLTIIEQDDKMIGIDTGSFILYLVEGKPIGSVFEFLVDDLESARTILLAAGCAIVQEDPSVPNCYMRDPYGLVFNIAER